MTKGRTGIYNALKEEAKRYGVPTTKRYMHLYYARYKSCWNLEDVFTKAIRERHSRAKKVVQQRGFFQRVVAFLKGLFK